VLKAVKHIAWFIVALWTGYTFVGYFSPIRELGITMHLAPGPWESFWIVFYGFATYGNAGFMREQVCKYMCPYARFQSVMFDKDTLVITYDEARGEPRGSRRRGQSGASRDSAIASTATSACRCARPASTSARAAVRMHRLRRLHRRLQPGHGQDGLCARAHSLLDAECADQGIRPADDVAARAAPAHARLLDGARGLDDRDRRVDRPCATRSRSTSSAIAALLAREAAPGVIENVYRIQLMNTDETPRRFEIRCRRLPRAHRRKESSNPSRWAPRNRGCSPCACAPPSTTLPAPTMPRDLKSRLHNIEFTVRSVDEPQVVRHETSTFIVPPLIRLPAPGTAMCGPGCCSAGPAIVVVASIFHRVARRPQR
jgi:hypothetical protein